MSAHYGLTTSIILSKASLAQDEDAIESLNEAYSLIDDKEFDSIELIDIDTNTCCLNLSFAYVERPNDNADAISGTIDMLKEHAVRAFRVIGDNEDAGPFEDIDGPNEGYVEQAVQVGAEKAVEAALRPHQKQAVARAMSYAQTALSLPMSSVQTGHRSRLLLGIEERSEGDPDNPSVVELELDDQAIDRLLRLSAMAVNENVDVSTGAFSVWIDGEQATGSVSIFNYEDQAWLEITHERRVKNMWPIPMVSQPIPVNKIVEAHAQAAQTVGTDDSVIVAPMEEDCIQRLLIASKGVLEDAVDKSDLVLELGERLAYEDDECDEATWPHRLLGEMGVTKETQAQIQTMWVVRNLRSFGTDFEELA